MQVGRLLTPERIECIRKEIERSQGDTVTAIAKRCSTATATVRAIRDGTIEKLLARKRVACPKGHKRNKISDERIREVEAAMDAEPDVPAYVIGQRYGISVSMSRAIRGRYVDRARESHAKSLRRARQAESVKGVRSASAMPKRCPTCGGMVFMPCLRCKLNKDEPMRAERSYGLALVLDGKSTRRPYR